MYIYIYIHTYVRIYCSTCLHPGLFHEPSGGEHFSRISFASCCFDGAGPVKVPFTTTNFPRAASIAA